MTCVELHHVGGQPATKLGSLRKVASLMLIVARTCTSSGTLSKFKFILTCRQKKHAIEVLGRVLTVVVVLRCMCVNVMTFSRVAQVQLTHSKCTRCAFSQRVCFSRAPPTNEFQGFRERRRRERRKIGDTAGKKHQCPCEWVSPPHGEGLWMRVCSVSKRTI